MLFWKNDKIDFTEEELIKILKACYKHSLYSPAISADINSSKGIQLVTFTFKHQLEGKGSTPYSPEGAADNHAKKIADRLEILEY